MASTEHTEHEEDTTLPVEARPNWIAQREVYRAELRKQMAENGITEREFVADRVEQLELVESRGAETLTDAIMDAMMHDGLERQAEDTIRRHNVLHAPHARLDTLGTDVPQEQWGSFYHPKAVLFLDEHNGQEMSYATRDSIQRTLAALPRDWRYSKVERKLLGEYLEGRLEAFENDTETLEAVERRDFGYQG